CRSKSQVDGPVAPCRKRTILSLVKRVLPCPIFSRMNSFIPGSSASICPSDLTICTSWAKPEQVATNVASVAANIPTRPNLSIVVLESDCVVRCIVSSRPGLCECIFENWRESANLQLAAALHWPYLLQELTVIGHGIEELGDLLVHELDVRSFRWGC